MLYFFFNDTATTEIYTLSLHDALPIFLCSMTVLPSAVHSLPLARFICGWRSFRCAVVKHGHGGFFYSAELPVSEVSWLTSDMATSIPGTEWPQCFFFLVLPLVSFEHLAQ